MNNNSATKLHFTVEPSISEILSSNRLDLWLANCVSSLPSGPILSRNRLKHLILEGFVSIHDRKITDPATAVKLGDKYTVQIPKLSDAIPQPQSIALDVIHEDSDLIVINKPSGMVVHPAPGSYDGTLVNALLAHCGESLSGIGGVRRPGIVHRLDKDTSGLLVIAKSDDAHQKLVHQFAARTVKRKYTAVVWGSPKNKIGRIDAPIGRSRQNRKKMAVIFRGGKKATTNFKKIEEFLDVASLLECRLESGRTHQIRVHMKHIGHSLIGDTLYGGSKRRKGIDEKTMATITALGRQALHSHYLEFKHPALGKVVKFNSDIPIDIENLIYSLRELSE